MVIVRLRGGLGNQMFQYAMGKRIALHYNTNVKLDLTSLLKKGKKDSRPYQLHIFNIEEDFFINPKLIEFLYKNKLNFVTQLIKRIKGRGIKKIKEQSFSVQEDLITNPQDNRVYTGYWQSEKYFKEVRDEILKDFSFKEELSPGAQNILDNIKTKNSVCVHVRRGDYVGDDFFQSMGLDYFKKASDYLNEHNSDLHFYIFSDDTEWCKENIKLDYDFTIVDYKTDKIRYKEDLQLMSLCNHFIISASSFSWWAVWLGSHDNKMVVAPKKWFLDTSVDVSDLVGENWVRI